MLIRSWKTAKHNKLESPRPNSVEEPYDPMRQSYVEHRIELTDIGPAVAGFSELPWVELRKYEDDRLVEALRFSTFEDARRYYVNLGHRYP